MLRNYLKIALRTLWKQKTVAAINVVGLAAGMAVCLLVGLLFWDQVTHDDFHPGADRLYRVTTDIEENSSLFATSPAPLVSTLRDDVTGVQSATRFRPTTENIVLENTGYRAQGLFADASFFRVFGFELVAGDEEGALSRPNTAVLSEKLAVRLYGDTDALGETFRLPEVGRFTVTGVVDRASVRSHLPFDALYSLATIRESESNEPESWADAWTDYTYLRLEPGARAADLRANLREIANRRLPSAATDATVPQAFHPQALSGIPLSEVLSNEVADGMLPATAAYFLAALALLVLIAAGFNYVNLSTARSLTRAREVGVRKTVGARRRQVMGQFVAEGIVVALLALGLGFLLLEGLVYGFNRLAVVQQTLNAPIEIEPGLLFYATGATFAIAVGLVAGLYPAWHLSKFQPSPILRASGPSGTPGAGALTSRKALIVLQFAIALVTIVSAVLFYRQGRHRAYAEYALQLDHVAQIPLQDADAGLFQEAARQESGVQQVGAASHLPIVSQTKYTWSVTASPIPDTVNATYYSIDYDAVRLLELPLVATQNFTETRFESGRTALISETAVEHFDFKSPEQALGEPLWTEGADSSRTLRIVGVVEDFPIPVSRTGVEPLLFHHNPDRFDMALARVHPEQEQAALTALEATWSQFDDLNPFEGQFIRDRMWRTKSAPLADTGWILGLVGGIAVFISCLGLLGIAIYTVQTRTREVGIRKALGATVADLVALLSKDFLWLVGTAMAIGLPLAWWLNRLWLRGFHYRIELTGWTFVLSAVGLAALALIAIGSQTVRAARIDPATTLRDE